MINKSFQLLRTNPLLTSNFKVVVNSNYSLYLESFNSTPDLNDVRFKHVLMSKNELLENKIPYFYRKLPIELAFSIKYDNDNQIVQNTYDRQFDTTYYAGASFIEDQWYSEEFDYLAPLYIRKNNLPEGFVILRVDDPSGYNLNVDNNFELNSLTSNNFNEIINNWKCVKFFDMSYNSDFGYWLYNNYVNNNRFPKSAFDYNPIKDEFSYWYGMDYNTGIYTSKPIYMDDRDEIETPHFRLEKFITEGYKNSGLIYPYILNLKFLFDDTPATPYSLRKYSMNRYYGFYVDKMEFVSSITSYVTPTMRPDTYTVNNIIVSGSTGMTADQYCRLDYYDIPSVNPFIEDWDDAKEYYIFIDNTSDFYREKTISGLYPVNRTLLNGKYVYKIISDEILDNYWNTGYTNLKTVNITYNNYNIISGSSSDFFVDKYIDCNGNEKYMYGDLYLIKVDDKLHVLKYSSGITEQNELTVNPITGDIEDYKYYIQTDYAINLNEKILEYWILGKNSSYYKKYDVQVAGYQPLTFPIYRIKFSDIKDFDFDRVNTNYSNFDYEKTEYVETDEEKLHAFNYNDPSIPPSKRTDKIGTTGQYKISNISSEYIADDELYEIVDLGQQNTVTTSVGSQSGLYDLNDIWRKNQSICKWGFMGSISHSDYPYKFNNNYEVGGPYNRTSDPFYTIPDINSKNMDYFYRIGTFYHGTKNDLRYYKNQTTNIQDDFTTGQLGDGFDIEAHFTLNFDYFSFYFKNKMYYEDTSILYTKNYSKYSIFNYGDDNVNSISLFKGLKINIKEIKNIYTDTNNNIVKILHGNKTFNDYKLSIIFNEIYSGVSYGVINDDNGYLDMTQNNINIILHEKFKNILIIINAKLNDYDKLNDLSAFTEKDGLYYGKKIDDSYISDYNPYTFICSNFIDAINDYNADYGLQVNYYYIKNENQHGKVKLRPLDFTNSTMTNITDWNYAFPPYILSIEKPILMDINNDCYTTSPYYVNSVQDDYVGTVLNFNELGKEKKYIYRFGGPYEPIFKDIGLFKEGYFCYNNITTGTTVASAITSSYSSGSGQIYDYSSYPWFNLTNICKGANKYVELNAPLIKTESYSRYLYINGFEFSDIPNSASISGITLSLTRMAGKYDAEGLTVYVKDIDIRLTTNINDINYMSGNKASLVNPDYYWTTDLLTIDYGTTTYDDLWTDNSPGVNWPGVNLIGSHVNNSLFGVMIRVGLLNTIEGPPIILPQIQCARITIKYQWNKTTYTSDRTVYFDNNYKFDTTINNFGMIDELIYSKVNEENDILRNSLDLYHIYPSLDEYGYDYKDRFIFKSSWDKEFFTKTKNTLTDQSGIV